MVTGQAQVEAGLRVYAIGDVHGCIDQLRSLIDLIDSDLDSNPSKRHRLVFLGDYVDRGPDNRGVIQFLTELDRSPRDCTFLLGNHDERVITFLENPEIVWDDMMNWGGARTLADYGIVPEPGETADMISKRFSSTFPKDHLCFLKSLQHSHVENDYFFCHAGVRPNVPLAEQANHDLLWIRRDFLHHEAPFEKVIVHGHTPHKEPEVRSNRINVDTHCYETGKLTALVLEGDQHRFIAT